MEERASDMGYARAGRQPWEREASRMALGLRLGWLDAQSCVEMHQTASVCTDSLSFHFNAATETPSHSPAASQDTALKARE